MEAPIIVLCLLRKRPGVLAGGCGICHLISLERCVPECLRHGVHKPFCFTEQSKRLRRDTMGLRFGQVAWESGMIAICQVLCAHRVGNGSGSCKSSVVIF